MGATVSRPELLHEQVIGHYLGPGFVERTWLADRVERHLRDPACRFVLLCGGPGTGKSALLAWLTRRHELSPRYFLRRQSHHPLAGGDAASMLLSVGHQVAVLRPQLMRSDLDLRVSQRADGVAATGRLVAVRVGVLRTSPFHHTAVRVAQQAGEVAGDMVALEVDRLVADVRVDDLGALQRLALIEPATRLAASDPGALLVVLIDGVDELRYQWNPDGADILDWLAQCPELPPNVRLVVASRPDGHLLRRFRLAQADRLREERIEAEATEVRKDLLSYARRLLADPTFAGLSSGLARRVAERAAGSFLYLTLWGRALRDAVRTGDRTRTAALTDLTALPDGLHDMYEFLFVLITGSVRAREGAAWRRVWNLAHRPLLGALAVAQAPMREETLVLAAGLASDRTAAGDALDDLTHVLIEEDSGIRLCHLSLAEFLTVGGPRTTEPWRVDADGNHGVLAERLVGAFGDSWETCDDPYPLDHTVAHLVAAARRAGPGPANERLTGLLGDHRFGLAKGRRAGVPAVLADYVAAHSVVGAEDIADGLATVLARLVDEGSPDVAGNLHAGLGYRLATAELHREVLRRLSDPGHLERFVSDDARRRSALVDFSHAEATRLRRTGEVEAARRILARAVSAIDEPSARLCYELGYLDFLGGDHEPSSEWLRRSVAAAVKQGDRTGAYISRLVGLRVGLLAGTVDAATYRAVHEAAVAYFAGPDAVGPHAARWAASAQSQLVDLGLWTGDVDLIAAGIRALEADPWLHETGREDLLDRQRARAAVVGGEWRTACELYGRLLAEDLGDPPSSREELARDLYYYGRALAGLGDLAGARRVWEIGLRSPDNAANWPWKPKIAAALRSPTPEA